MQNIAAETSLKGDIPFVVICEREMDISSIVERPSWLALGSLDKEAGIV